MYKSPEPDVRLAATARVPAALPDIHEEDIAAVVAVLRSGVLSLGSEVVAFERAIADHVGAAHAVAVSSGTAGLHLGVRAAGFGPGDEVITSAFSFVASANCLLYEGAVPVFVDIEEDSLGIDPDRAAAAVTGRTRGLLPVHVFGRPAAIHELVDLAAAYRLTIVEDACEALGSAVRGRHVGTFGQSGCFSFYPNKQITTGEGAVVVTDDAAVAAAMRSMRNQGRNAMGAWLTHETLGYNYRLTEMSAALGRSQMARLDDVLDRRAAIAQGYAERLADVPGVEFMQAGLTTTRMSWFVAVARLDPRFDRDRVIARLAACGIEARAYFAPIHLQPLYRDRFGFRGGELPVTERIARTTLALPFFTTMDAAQLDYVCDHLAAILAAAPLAPC